MAKKKHTVEQIIGKLREAEMAKFKRPREGTKHRIIFDLISRPEGATREEINRATGWDAWGYWNDTKDLARRYGGTPHREGEGKFTRYWIK